MSTLFVAAILIGSITAICLFLVALHNRQKKKAAARLHQQFNDLGAEHRLSFSAQEVITNGLFGLDGVQRKLLVLSKVDEHTFTHSLVDLDNVKHCTLQKQYSSASAAGSKPEEHLTSLALRFQFAGTSLPVEMVFYDHVVNSVFELPALSKKARHWELLLVKMLRPGLKNIA